MEQDQEFYISVAILGGIVFAGLMVVVGLSLVAIGIYNRVTKNKVTKDLYDEKRKENGKAQKGGSRGSW